jgi:hypothetical protein
MPFGERVRVEPVVVALFDQAAEQCRQTLFVPLADVMELQRGFSHLRPPCPESDRCVILERLTGKPAVWSIRGRAYTRLLMPQSIPPQTNLRAVSFSRDTSSSGRWVVT